ncbi:hypothetical protein D3C87_792760 [compost metagenome]
MPRNGTGGYSLPNNSWNPAVNGAAATAADWQNLINDVAAAVQQSVSSDGQTPMTGSLNMGGFVISALGAPSGSGQSLRWEQLTKGADIASAATITIPIEGNVFHVTGTTQIATINDTYPGRITYLVFDGVLVLKNSAGLSLPGGADITTKAGEAYAILNDSPGVWRLVGYPTRVDVQVGNIPSQGFKNALINSNFPINQGGVSGTVVLTAGAYGHDQWKAGSGGCTYTFATSAGVTTLTISAGTLVQPIEGSSLSTGTYTLSWGGTAQGKIGAGVFSASGVTGSVTGGTNLNVEFGTGTLFKPQLEPGTNATPFDLRPAANELVFCQRYYRTTGTNIAYTNPGNNATVSQNLTFILSPPMRAAPTVGTAVVNGTVVLSSASPQFVIFNFPNGGSVNNVWSWTADARL